MSTKKMLKHFNTIYKTGYRFITEEDEKDINFFSSKQTLEEGVYKYTTIAGLKSLAMQGKLKMKDKYLTPEDVDKMFNWLFFVLANEHKLDKEHKLLK